MHIPVGTPITVWILTAIFAFGCVVNAVGPGPLRGQYAGWGYPSWFRFVTSALEFATACLLIFPDTRLFGACLGAVIMLAAIATLLRGGQYPVVLVPGVVLVLALLTAWPLF